MIGYIITAKMAEQPIVENICINDIYKTVTKYLYRLLATTTYLQYGCFNIPR